MLEFIALIILICSLIGAGAIIYRKMPLALKFSGEPVPLFNRKDSFRKIKERLPFKDFSFETFLQKILSKVRILTLKTDSKTSTWLQKLRKKSQNKKLKEENDNYWQKVKDSTKK